MIDKRLVRIFAGLTDTTSDLTVPSADISAQRVPANWAVPHLMESVGHSPERLRTERLMFEAQAELEVFLEAKKKSGSAKKSADRLSGASPLAAPKVPDIKEPHRSAAQHRVGGKFAKKPSGATPGGKVASVKAPTSKKPEQPTPLPPPPRAPSVPPASKAAPSMHPSLAHDYQHAHNLDEPEDELSDKALSHAQAYHSLHQITDPHERHVAAMGVVRNAHRVMTHPNTLPGSKRLMQDIVTRARSEHGIHAPIPDDTTKTVPPQKAAKTEPSAPMSARPSMPFNRTKSVAPVSKKATVRPTVRPTGSEAPASAPRHTPTLPAAGMRRPTLRGLPTSKAKVSTAPASIPVHSEPPESATMSLGHLTKAYTKKLTDRKPKSAGIKPTPYRGDRAMPTSFPKAAPVLSTPKAKAPVRALGVHADPFKGETPHAEYPEAIRPMVANAHSVTSAAHAIGDHPKIKTNLKSLAHGHAAMAHGQLAHALLQHLHQNPTMDHAERAKTHRQIQTHMNAALHQNSLQHGFAALGKAHEPSKSPPAGPGFMTRLGHRIRGFFNRESVEELIPVKGRIQPPAGQKMMLEMPKDPQKLLGMIHKVAKVAATHRLAGRMQQAMHHDNHLDRLHAHAEKLGLGDHAVMADEKGRQAAEVEDESY